jgi:hypothetical protein
MGMSFYQSAYQNYNLYHASYFGCMHQDSNIEWWEVEGVNMHNPEAICQFVNFEYSHCHLVVHMAF